MKRYFFSALLFTLFFFVFNTESARAASRGGGAGIRGDHSITLGASIIGTTQSDINNSITLANASSNGPISTKNLTSAYEFFGDYSFRFNGTMYALVFRPSYFTESSEGTGSNSTTYNYKMSGYTFFPMLRFYPLENAFIKFYLQLGIGWGKLNTDITAGSSSNTISFSGTNFGSNVGLGAQFCFTANHCVDLEGNVRYLPIDRNIVSAVSGTGKPGIDDATVNAEAEYQNRDLGTTLSGIQGVLAYTYNF